MGGLVPKSYYLANQPKTEIANKKDLTLSPGTKERLEFLIDIPNSILRYWSSSIFLVILFLFEALFFRWEFYSETADVAFAVYRKAGKEAITLIPHGRVDCHISTEEGELRCEETGTCKYF